MTGLFDYWKAHGKTKIISRVFGVLVLFLSISLTACSPETFFTNLTSSADSKVLFQDDFSKTSGGWTTQRDENSIIDYENGGFRIWVNQPNFDYWSVPGLRFTDVSIDVDAKKLSGPDDNDFGIICRYKDQNNFYGFLISSDGYYGISKRKDGDHAVIGGQGMRPNAAINKGTAINHIHADCIGSTLTLYVNNEKMAQVTDSDFTLGDAGMLAGSFAQSGVDILFQKFSVQKP